MIYESWYWKQDLQKVAERMRKRSTQTRWMERSMVKVEKDLFVSFYAIRKLIEAQKLSKPIMDMTLPAASYPAKGNGVTHFNAHRIDEHFDFDQERLDSLDLPFVCNQIIHSYIFIPYMKENATLGGILFCSDFKRNERLFRLELDAVISCLERVAADDPSELHAVLDPKSDDFKLTLY